jgi:hypothetical protein
MRLEALPIAGTPPSMHRPHALIAAYMWKEGLRNAKRSGARANWRWNGHTAAPGKTRLALHHAEM